MGVWGKGFLKPFPQGVVEQKKIGFNTGALRAPLALTSSPQAAKGVRDCIPTPLHSPTAHATRQSLVATEKPDKKVIFVLFKLRREKKQGDSFYYPLKSRSYKFSGG